MAMTPHDPLHSFGREFRRHPYLIVFAIILVGLGLWAIVPFPTRTIKHVIVRAAKIVQARDIGRLQPLFAKEFECPLTGDRETTIERLSEAFRELYSLAIKIKRIKIQHEGDRATANVDFYITWSLKRGEAAKVPIRGLSGEPSLANPLERLQLGLVKEADGYWRFSSAKFLSPAPSAKAAASL